MANLYDLMTDEDKAIVKNWAIERQTRKYKTDVPMPFFVAAQLGFYYGWEAVLAFRRGFTVRLDSFKDKDGSIHLRTVKESFTLEEATALIKAAEKVDYLKKTENSKILMAHEASNTDKQWSRANTRDVQAMSQKILG